MRSILATLVISAAINAVHAHAQTTGGRYFPANRATGVNPDTHLVLTFASVSSIGKSGVIRIYDNADHHVVDTLDLSIPAGPDPTRRITSPPAQAIDPNPPTPTTTTPAVKTTPAAGVGSLGANQVLTSATFGQVGSTTTTPLNQVRVFQGGIKLSF